MLNKMRDAGSSIVYLKSEGWGGGCAQTQPWAPLSAFGQSVALVPACSAVVVIVVLVCFIAGAVAGGEKEEWGRKMRVRSERGKRPVAVFLLICSKVSVSLYREG